MKYCDVCRRYTLEDICPRCHGQSLQVGPARFSPQDPYGEYRRKLKKQHK
ncbi:MAG TPA: RNA-protein complex protein Nop10 [Thermoplasmatales archaeon]|nr:RNA-protein complex protein Nop10 [Candidatus Thermoplasmatota archaeon]MDD5778763.1 RNA-protein complex protein Nop10 [Candidatus Thermoplasmatota archaeon]HDS59330.1 RNA-protein complex protein Nop10 [Thermoplasmatales archaeon]